MKIAVVGSGISGLSAAYYLSKKNHVDLFEKEDHFGGHSYTIDLMIGTKKEITTLDGKKLSISIPKATQPGTVLSITEQGLPARGGRRGNIYLTIQADIPNITDQNTLNKIKGIRNGTD